mmetsp:Transcript_41548/g.97223  ORF Transcript_41548/g.97223 Transcript_41548/m.97223 type:complete len:201 (-) Transcript_41548:555-1157(-)
MRFERCRRTSRVTSGSSGRNPSPTPLSAGWSRAARSTRSPLRRCTTAPSCTFAECPPTFAASCCTGAFRSARETRASCRRLVRGTCLLPMRSRTMSTRPTSPRASCPRRESSSCLAKCSARFPRMNGRARRAVRRVVQSRSRRLAPRLSRIRHRRLATVPRHSYAHEMLRCAPRGSQRRPTRCTHPCSKCTPMGLARASL